MDASAFVEYFVEKENEKTRRRVKSMSFGPRNILSIEDYTQKHAPLGFEFVVFIILLVIPVFLPYFQYRKASSILKK